MPLILYIYSKKRDSRRAHFRGREATHSTQLAKLGTKGEVRELGTFFITMDIRRWCGEKRSGRKRPSKPEARQGQGAGEGKGPQRIKYKNMYSAWIGAGEQCQQAALSGDHPRCPNMEASLSGNALSFRP